MIISIILVVLLGLWMAWSVLSIRGVKEPSYTVIAQRSGYEIRAYQPYIVAEVTVNGPFDQALNQGFQILAGYIFGGNTTQEKIAMTAPVKMIDKNTQEHTMEFLMPANYTLNSLAIPNNKNIRFREVPAQEVAVIQFSGIFSQKRFDRKKADLIQYLQRDGLVIEGNVQIAGYNPPWTCPWLTRNEVWAIIKSSKIN